MFVHNANDNYELANTYISFDPLKVEVALSALCR